jgi:hypothetical protein
MADDLERLSELNFVSSADAIRCAIRPDRFDIELLSSSPTANDKQLVARRALYSRALRQQPSVHCQLSNYRAKVPGLQEPKLPLKENLLQTFSVIVV